MKKILIIEDDPDQQMLLKKYLGRHFSGEGLTVVNSGADFFNGLPEDDFHLIILDYAMPEMNGIEFLEKMEKNKMDIPVVMITAQGNENVAVEAMKKGAYDYIVKTEDFFPALPLVAEKVLEKHALKKSLREAEGRYRQLFENASDILLVADPETMEFLDVNLMAVNTLGYSKDEIMGMSLSQITLEEEREDLKNCVCHILKEKRINIRKRTFVKKNLEPVICEINAQLIDCSKKAVMLSICRNVTERIRWEDRFRQSEKLASIGRLTAGVAHEILNPLQIILGRMQLLRAKGDSSGDLKGICKKVEDQVNRVINIADKLFHFSRRNKPLKEKLNVEEIIERTLGLLRYDVESAGIHIYKDMKPNLPFVMAYADELLQVFLNITKNAIDGIAERERRHKGPDFFKKEIEITASCLSDSRMVKIRFKDTGIGVSEEIRNKIFDPFFTTKEPGKGTGLGLSVSYGIIKSHGGDLLLEPNENGGASTVVLLKGEIP